MAKRDPCIWINPGTPIVGTAMSETVGHCAHQRVHVYRTPRVAEVKVPGDAAHQEPTAVAALRKTSVVPRGAGARIFNQAAKPL